MKKPLKLAIGILCVLPLVGLADPPGAERGNGREGRLRGPESRPRDGEMSVRRPGDRLRDFSPTDEQIAAAEPFIQEHSPNRFRAYKKSTGQHHSFLVKSFVRGYIELKALENQDPPLYAMKLDQLATEDEIFGAVVAARETKLPQDKLREQLRPLVRELLAKRKEEMQHRIDKLELAKAAETRRLSELNSISESWIDTRIDDEINRNGRPMPLGGARRAGNRMPSKATSSASE